MLAIKLAEKGWVPDALIRREIRSLCAQRLAEERHPDPRMRAAALEAWAATLKNDAITIHADSANRQHYELPPEFFALTLGPHLKYSACFWPVDTRTLPEAERATLALTCDRAELADGQHILELGCGWGSLTLWMAEKYPNSHITAVSNSALQRQFITRLAADRGLNNLKVLTCDIKYLELSKQFDRVVSVEMFEHVRNYQTLLHRIAGWLTNEGRLFVHIFCHRDAAYPFIADGANNWMGRYFFTGGQMPAQGIFDYFADDLQVEQQWSMEGCHYERTANAWLNNMDAHKTAIQALFARTYGPANAQVWTQRWRIFFMSCAELFGYAGGKEWLVSHYRFRKP